VADRPTETEVRCGFFLIRPPSSTNESSQYVASQIGTGVRGDGKRPLKPVPGSNGPAPGGRSLSILGGRSGGRPGRKNMRGTGDNPGGR
jgi:hypothetical protein